jgi:hypothetical protein
MCLKSIIGCRIEICLSIAKQRNIGPCQAHLRIPTNRTELFSIVGKWHIFLEQIHFRDYAKEVLDRHFELSLHPHGHFLALIIDLVIHAHSFFSLIEDVVRLIKVFIEMGHSVILFMDFPDEVCFVLRKLAIGIIKKKCILVFLALA